MNIFIVLGILFLVGMLFAFAFLLLPKEKPLINTDQINLPPGWKLESNGSGKYRLLMPEGRYYAMKSTFSTRKEAIDNAWHWVDLKANENDSTWKVVEGE